jgi:tetratricopeptide (TPR) repeat protein
MVVDEVIGIGRNLSNAVMFVRKARKEGAMNRGAVGSRNRETGTDAPCHAMTTRKVAQKAVVVISIWFFSGTLSTAIGQQPTPSVTAIESLIRSRQYDQALAMTRSALEQRPTDFRLWTLEGIIFSMQDKAQSAQSAFEQALRISPQYAPALKGEVQILYDQSDNRAIPLLERILKDDPKDRTAHQMLALLERKEDRCEPAVVHFAASLDATKKHTESLEAYGYCLVQLKKFQDAIPVFEKLITLLPNRAYPRYDLAVVQVANKQNEVALKTLEPLLTPDQSDPDILSLASQAAEATKDTVKAVALLRQAIVLSPTTQDYYIAFATLCLDHESFQVGIDMINAGLSRIPNAARLYLSRGLLYAEEAEYDKAEADFARAEQLDANQGMSSYAADLAQVQKNNPDEALRRVRLQLKAHPESPLLHYLLAQLLMKNADTDSDAYKEAMKEDLRALELKPDFVNARNLMAKIHMRAGHYEKAIEQCRAALQYAPNDETATYHLLISLRHAGKKDELQPLVKRLNELHQQSVQNETDRKRYALVEQLPIPNSVPSNE